MSKYSLIILMSILVFPSCVKANIKQSNEVQAEKEGEVVFLLHGILNKPIFMKRIENALKKDGYEVVNWGYKSTKRTIDEHTLNLHQSLQSYKNKKVHFVAFSLGSIIIRCYLNNYPMENAGRFVMIAPPNHGSSLVDKLYPHRWFRWIWGKKSIKQLSKSKNKDLNSKCGIPSIEFGIIAGGKGNKKGFSSFLPGDDDGTVSVESAKLKGAKDFILLPHRHTFLIFQSKTSCQVKQFLLSGKFDHEVSK